MKHRAVFFLIIAVIFLFSCSSSEPQGKSQPEWSVYFSPNGGCTKAIIQELNQAKTSVLVQAYSFTSAPIAEALLDAHKRGVKVEVILDKSQRTEKYSSADFLTNFGILVRIDSAHAIAHNKVMILDEHTVITGSFNFTKAAEEKNAENLLVIKDKELAQKYFNNWKKHAEHSEPYIRKTQINKSSKKGGINQ